MGDFLSWVTTYKQLLHSEPDPPDFLAYVSSDLGSSFTVGWRDPVAGEVDGFLLSDNQGHSNMRVIGNRFKSVSLTSTNQNIVPSFNRLLRATAEGVKLGADLAFCSETFSTSFFRLPNTSSERQRNQFGQKNVHSKKNCQKCH